MHEPVTKGIIRRLQFFYRPDKDIYIISTGYRWYKAIGTLGEQFPHDERFKTIDCAVYEVTDDQFKLKQALPYIIREQEEGIYRDSNLENRQLSYEDVVKQIRYIIHEEYEPLMIYCEYWKKR